MHILKGKNRFFPKENEGPAASEARGNPPRRGRKVMSGTKHNDKATPKGQTCERVREKDISSK